MNIPELDPDLARETPNEWTMVERPLLVQLAAMGWDYLQGDLDYPQKTHRQSFREVLLLEPLRRAINASERLDELTIDRAIESLKRCDKPEGLGRNQELTEKLIKGVSVVRANGGEGAHGRNVTVRFIDFDPALQANNSFLAINQFRIDSIGRVGFVIPDVLLFVNGLPLVIIECKSPSLAETDDGGFWKPIEKGIDQLLRYANSRDEVELEEGVEHLFHWNQLMIATCQYAARVATYGADYKHYVEWKDTAPLTEATVLAEIGRPGTQLRSQERLVAGMLRPAHLLDILRHFILFQIDEGKLIKICPRYQQYRAVQKAMARLATGKTKMLSSKQRDERGGIIWHTQGSGKSITMVQLVRKLRTDPQLCGFKVVVVTDRTSLEQQLQETAQLTGERVRPDKDDVKAGESSSDLVKRILREEGPDLVFCMVQKNQDREGETVVLEYEVPLPPPRMLTTDGDAEFSDTYLPEAAERQGLTSPDNWGDRNQNRTKKLRQVIRNEVVYPEINPSEKILLLIDECHRSHTSALHANLMRALPNAAKIGFTGTPIMQRDRGNTLNIFDDFIDRYSMRQAEADEATVKILYEGRVPLGLVAESSRLDAQVAIKFAEFTAPEQQLIMQKFATERKVMEAPKLIAAKARDMLRHYVRNILPGNCKAQVVAASQEAVVLYQMALCAARDELVAEAERIESALLALAEEELLGRSEDERTLVAAYNDLEKIKGLEFAAVISKRHNQSADWDTWTDPVQTEQRIANFKKPFAHKDPEKASNLAILCVMRMLLTGFDAPVEQALYIDRRIIEHDLLQAIARVNRKRLGKECGYIIDYIGLARELRTALTESEEGGEGGPRPPTGIDGVRDEIPRLQDRHHKALEVFHSRGIAELMPIDPCVDLLEDAKIRAEFLNRVGAFFASLAIVLPRPEAMPFVRNAKILGFVAKVAANLYRDNQLNLEGVDRRMKRLIDQYITAQGIDPRIAPVAITDINFLDLVQRKKNARARASEMKHALRRHIQLRLDEDPTHYKKLSERLEAIIQQFKDNWQALEEALQTFIEEELARGEQSSVPGLDPRLHAPFFGTLKEAVEKELGAELKSEDPAFREVIDLTVSTVEEIRERIRLVDFWRDEHSRRSLEKSVYRTLLRSGKIARDKLAELATRVVEQARNLHRLLVWGNGTHRD